MEEAARVQGGYESFEGVWPHQLYRCSWAHYELATAAAISLMPPEHALSALESDYRHMQNMIFGPRPPFSEIVDTVRDLEAEIHGKGARVN